MAKTLQHQIIARALEIVSDEEAWSRGALARTSRGEPCAVCDPKATRFCAVGAISRAVFELLGQSDMTVVKIAASCVLAANKLQEASLPTINDLEGHEMIVSLFQKALA